MAVWEDSVQVRDGELFLCYQVHNEAITIPENVDCIRAVAGVETNGRASIDRTDRALGVMKEFLPGPVPAALVGAAREDARYEGEDGARRQEMPPERRPQETTPDVVKLWT